MSNSPENYDSLLKTLLDSYAIALAANYGKENALPLQLIESRLEDLGTEAVIKGKRTAIRFYESQLKYPRVSAEEPQDKIDQLLEEVQVEDYQSNVSNLCTLYKDLAILTGKFIPLPDKSEEQENVDFVFEQIKYAGAAKLQRALSTVGIGDPDKYFQVEHLLLITPDKSGEIVVSLDDLKSMIGALEFANKETSEPFHL